MTLQLHSQELSKTSKNLDLHKDFHMNAHSSCIQNNQKW